MSYPNQNTLAWSAVAGHLLKLLVNNTLMQAENTLPSHLFLILMKTCVEKYAGIAMRTESLPSSAIQKQKLSAASQSLFLYVTEGQSSLNIFFSIEALPLQSLIFICMAVWGLCGLNFRKKQDKP